MEHHYPCTMTNCSPFRHFKTCPEIIGLAQTRKIYKHASRSFALKGRGLMRACYLEGGKSGSHDPRP